MKMILSGMLTQNPYSDEMMSIAHSSRGKRRENVNAIGT